MWPKVDLYLPQLNCWPTDNAESTPRGVTDWTWELGKSTVARSAV